MSVVSCVAFERGWSLLREHRKRHPTVFSEVILHSNKVKGGGYEYRCVGTLDGRFEDGRDDLEPALRGEVAVVVGTLHTCVVKW